jgi:HEAT repeat protein
VPEQQLDLFSDDGVWLGQSVQHSVDVTPPAAEMDDCALIAAIPWSNLAESSALATEAARRRLSAAVPALEALCRRFNGFGVNRMVPEQAAALEALAMIGGRDAAKTVIQLVTQGVVQGPALNVALSAAARLHATFPIEVLRPLLQHPDPRIRVYACRCACRLPELISPLVDRLYDLDPTVASSAACALGQMGRIEARPMLMSLLREKPSEEVIHSVASIADEDGMVLLGRIARSTPSLANVALDALEDMDHPRAGTIAATVRNLLRRP